MAMCSDVQAKMPAGSPEASPGRPSTSVRMLAAFFDASAGYHSGPGGSTASAALQGLRLESHIVLNSTEVEQKLASISQVSTCSRNHVCSECMVHMFQLVLLTLISAMEVPSRTN